VGIKNLIARVRSSRPEGDDLDALVTVMGELVDHHVGEEEEEMFPRARKADIDMADLGRLMSARRQELANQR
jgi:hypothetical protein